MSSLELVHLNWLYLIRLCLIDSIMFESGDYIRIECVVNSLDNIYTANINVINTSVWTKDTDIGYIYIQIYSI